MAACSSPGELRPFFSHSNGYRYFMYLQDKIHHTLPANQTQPSNVSVKEQIFPPLCVHEKRGISKNRGILTLNYAKAAEPYLNVNNRLSLQKEREREKRETYWVRRVKAALVMDVGRLRPLVISLQIFLLMTSTRPPFSVTSVYSLYRSNTCFAIMGMRLTGVPE